MTPTVRRSATALILVLIGFTNVAQAQRGGRGGGGGGMVGRGGGGGGMARPAQNFNRPAAPQNFNRPAQNFNRPQVNQNFNRPQVNQNFNRAAEINRGQINRGEINRNNQVNRGEINRGEINRNVNNVNRPVTNNIVNNRENINVNNTRINNVNNVNNINRGGYNGNYNRGGYNGNYNRGGYNGYGYGHGVGGYPGWGGGYGGFGGGYHANNYYGYHSNWVNGSWGNRFYPGYGGGYGGGYYGNYFGTNLLALGAGLGIAAWGVGSLSNQWGYSQYANPYYSSLYNQPQNVAFVSQPGSYDYSRPLDLASQPPPDNVMQTAESTLDNARQAFHAGDYAQALTLADQALAQTPNDPMLHEFRATCLFALRRYDEAAVPFYTVLSSGPGWDWTTMIGLYPDVEVYTAQLRALEDYCNANPRAASARFVLASLYLTQGSNDAAARKLREVVAIQPQDKLSAQLLGALTTQNQPGVAPNPDSPPPADAVPANPTPAPASTGAPSGPPLPTGPVPASLFGSWNASPSQGVTITLTLGGDKTFNWKVVEKGQAREFKGEANFDNGVLALVASDTPPMVAKIILKDPGHFNFKAVATPNDDPGLDFGK